MFSSTAGSRRLSCRHRSPAPRRSCSLTRRKRGIARPLRCLAPVQPCRAAPRLRPSHAGAALSALLRKNELRDQTSVSQTALKVLQAQREVVALYYWPPSGIAKSGRGEIDLLEDGQSARFKHSAHRRRAHNETRRLVGRPRQRKHRGSGRPLLDLVTREAPAWFQHSRHLARQPLLVRNVHRDSVRPDMVEGAVLERQGERVRLSNLDTVCEAAPCS